MKLTNKQKEEILENFRRLYRKHPAFRTDLKDMAERVKQWPTEENHLKDKVIENVF